jgi:hypothetical protein
MGRWAIRPSAAGLSLLLAAGALGWATPMWLGPTQAAASTDLATSPVVASAPPLTPADARRLIESADLADETTLDAIGTIRFTVAGAQAAAEVLASSDDDDVIWAAIWVYASSGRDASPLRRHMDSSDPTIATMAGATLVAFGERSGFATLERSLGTTEQLRGSRPPQMISDYAATTLLRYVPSIAEASPLDGMVTPAMAAAQWATWLRDHGEGLSFDASSGTWLVP